MKTENNKNTRNNEEIYTISSLADIEEYENIMYVEQDIEVQIEGSTSIYEFTIERDEGGNISGIPELRNTIDYDSETRVIREIFYNANCMYNLDQQLYDANIEVKNTSIIDKDDIDIYYLDDDDIEYLYNLGNEETITLWWKIIENRVYPKEEEE